MRKEIYLYGAGGHAKVILEILKSSSIVVKGIYDDGNTIPDVILGTPFIGKYKTKPLETKSFIIAIGNNKIRKKIASQLKANFEKAIHPFSSLSQSSNIGLGTVIMSGVSINASVKIGKHTIINTNSSIDHDCVLGDYVHVSPNACLSGCVTVGEGSHLGAGAVVIPEVTIGKWATIGAGAVITKDIPDYAVVVGNPGRILKYNHE